MNIRNFVIIAHIDHGKSTLADRLLEVTGTVEKRKMREQFLDMHPLEREKGITIKMQPVRMLYELKTKDEKLKIDSAGIFNREIFTLNLIDTPGHVDFSYEVSRSLAAVEGAVLLVDATQGVQAQTIANLRLAEAEGLVIIPVVNKIDLPSADAIKATRELAELLAVSEEKILKISGKTGEGVEMLLQVVIQQVPAPEEKTGAHLRALIFDSLYDPYQGIIAYVRVKDGLLKKGDLVRCMVSGARFEVAEVGVFKPERAPVEKLSEGEIGYIATGMKEPGEVKVGDTVTLGKDEKVTPLSGYQKPVPMVFASIFPESQDEYNSLRDALEKLKLNDAALFFEPEESSVLGRGYRAGFLGVLHMEIVSERIRRDYGLKVILTNPSVAFKIRQGQDESLVYSAARMPPRHTVDNLEEPWVRVKIISPNSYLGVLTTLISGHEGEITMTDSVGPDRISIEFEAPLREIVINFYDRLKSVTQGFASMAYDVTGFRPADLIRMDILVAGEEVVPLSEMIPREKIYRTARERVEKLKELLPRELFQIAIQASAEGRIIARETVPALKKDVTGYLYGGDRTRKMKLWKKQQRGKKRLQESGRVSIDSETYLKMLQR